MKEKWNVIKSRFWPPRKDQLLILILVGLLMAVIALPVEERDKMGEQEASAEEGPHDLEFPIDYENRMEQRLQELLCAVEGVGEVRVMLTFEGTGKKTVEKDVSVTEDTRQEETVYKEYGSSEREPYVTSQTNPRVEGVLVIAQGGGNSRIQQEIIEAAQALFGIEAHKIKIMKMEESK